MSLSYPTITRTPFARTSLRAFCAKLLPLVVLFALFVPFGLRRQTISTIGGTNYTGGNGVGAVGAVTFAVQNASGADILLTDIESYWQTAQNGTNTTLWASTSSLSGTYFPIGGPTWTVVGTGTGLAVPANGYYPTITGMTYLIPNGTTVRFVLEGSLGIRYSGATPVPAPSTFTNSGVTLLLGDHQIASANVGYGGSNANAGNTPRWFTGSITFMPAAACVGMPTAGAISGPSFVCSGASTDLQVVGSTVGTGITREWYSSLTPGGPYTTFVGSGTTVNTGPVTSDTYYVCVVTCTPSTLSDQTAEFHLPVTAGVSGTYTIDAGGGGDLLSFSEAAALLGCGVNGPVVFNVAPGSGPYVDRLILPQIIGASSVNTITFNGNGETLEHSPSVTGGRAAILLTGPTL
ncbi:MAG: hypothetical protein IPG69_03040 [Flavobacteriales bacterium]|nr:hypothetical protein [Flavobacteriales bacterium]